MARNAANNPPGKKMNAPLYKQIVFETPHGTLVISRMKGGKIAVKHPPEFQLIEKQVDKSS